MTPGSTTPRLRYETVKPVSRDTFDEQPFDDRACNLHFRPGGHEKQLIIFVHGFGGNGYSTWMEFPAMLFSVDSTTRNDIAIFNFESGLRTILIRRSKLDNDISRLAAALRELSEIYESIVIVGHSLGGIVAEAAIKSHLDFLSHRGEAETSSVTGLFVFASPRAGTGWANPLMVYLVHEFRWLKRFSSTTAQLETFFDTHVQSHAVANTGGLPYLIPRFACIGSRDNVSNSFSAGFGIPEDQRKYLHGNHRSISKPTAANRPQVDWVIQKMNVIAEIRQQYSRERDFQGTVSKQTTPADHGAFGSIVTELWHDTDGSSWARMYTEVLRAANCAGMPVRDVADKFAGKTAVDLLISVHDSGRVVKEVARDRHRVQAAIELQQANEGLTVGITAVGCDGEHAVAQINNWIDPIQPGKQIFTESAIDGEALREVVWRWVDSVTNRCLPNRSRARFRSFPDPLVDMDMPIEDYHGKGAYL